LDKSNWINQISNNGKKSQILILLLSGKYMDFLFDLPPLSSKPLHIPCRLILDTPFVTKSIISYGLIVYAKDTSRWVITQRKHSVEFLLIIRGLYRISHLPFLLSYITLPESLIIIKCLTLGPSIFKPIYLNDLSLSLSGLSYALLRMAESRSILLHLLSKINVTNNTLSWTWPKGRLSYSPPNSFSDRETPFDCAKREFFEEVELSLPPPIFLSDSFFSEISKPITGKIIESRFWIYIIPNEIPISPPLSHPEVESRLWASTDTCLSLTNHSPLFKRVIDIVSSTL